MARQESNREDILREATALVERAEFQLTGYEGPVVIGFRRDGAGSVFCGAAPVYQFNAACELRRAYWQGLLIKAEAGALASLDRNRTAERVELVRQLLSPEQSQAFLQELTANLSALGDALLNGRYELRGQVPETIDIVPRIQRWLRVLPHPPIIAQRPNAGG